MFRKLAKAARLSAYTQGRRGLKDGVAMTLEHIPALKNLKPELVVDVGANKGQFSLLARQLFPQARVIAFEPLSEPAMKFEKVLGGDQQVSLHHFAIGAAKEDREIYVSKRLDSSSLLPIGEQSTIFPGTEGVGTQSVKVAPLSDFLSAEELQVATLVKIDVQGFELEVLKGFGDLLTSIDWLFVECSYIELYKGQALVHEVVDILRDTGFGLQGVFGQQYDDKGRPVQADFLFARI